MQDDVYNRALFRRKSEAARNKLREMGGVSQQPRGIMASSAELMQAAMPAMQMRQTGAPTTMAPQMQPLPSPAAPQPLPTIVPGVLPALGTPQPQRANIQAQPQPMNAQPQPRPIGFGNGGSTDLIRGRGGELPDVTAKDGDPSLYDEYLNALSKSYSGVMTDGGVDIMETPVAAGPRTTEPITPAAVMAELRNNPSVQENPQLQQAASQLNAAVTSDKVSTAEKADLVAGAVTNTSSREGRAEALAEMTGQKPSDDMSLDQINQAIAQAVLGGAIGGPGSVAERIADAMVKGLSVKRETATKREDQAFELRVAQAKAEKPAKEWLDTAQGQAATKMFQDLVAGNYTVEAALDKMNELTPGLGTTFSSAMGYGTEAAAPAAPAAPAAQGQGAPRLSNFQRNAEGVVIGWNGQQWVNAQTGQPYAQ